jgi:hypothetical protein
MAADILAANLKMRLMEIGEQAARGSRVAPKRWGGSAIEFKPH